MQTNDVGRPTVDESNRTLGARRMLDIPVDEDGYVQPEAGGMSVTPDDPGQLPRWRRPVEFGGTGTDPVFNVQDTDLGPKLRFRADPERPWAHGFVEPARRMKFEEYQE